MEIALLGINLIIYLLITNMCRKCVLLKRSSINLYEQNMDGVEEFEPPFLPNLYENFSLPTTTTD